MVRGRTRQVQRTGARSFAGRAGREAAHAPEASGSDEIKVSALLVHATPERYGDFTIGDRFMWQARPVELIDLARLGRDWQQVVVRFLDDTRQPAISMPFQDLVAGLSI